MKPTISALSCLAMLASATMLHAATEGAPDWVYADGDLPEEWSLANESYAICDAGLMQSPIDLDQANVMGDVNLTASYGLTEGVLKLGQAKVQVDVEPGMGMISGGELFNLLQLHFHTPAEHAMNGQLYPLVAHFVHSTKGGHLGVLGVMFELGPENPVLQTIIAGMESGNSSVSLNVGALAPDDLSVYRYMGSLTTPPCSEGVNWHVAEHVLTASESQIATLSEQLGASNRSLQPINNRLIVSPE